MESKVVVHPHISHQTEYIQLIIAAVIGPVLLIPLEHIVPEYFIFLQLLYMAAIVWFFVLKLPDANSREGGALLLGFLFALMANAMPLTDITYVSDAQDYFYGLLFSIPLFTVSALIMTVPAMRSRYGFVEGLIAALLLLFVIQQLR